MNSNEEILQKITKYEPVLLGFFCVAFIAQLLRLPGLEIPLSILAYALLMLYVFKVIVHEGKLDKTENWIRKVYLLVVILGMLTLVMHIQQWYYFPWGMKLFLIGIPLIVIISTVRKIEFKGVFGANDVFLTTFIYVVTVPLICD